MCVCVYVSIVLVLLDRESYEVAIAGFGFLGSAAVTEAEPSVAGR